MCLHVCALHARYDVCVLTHVHGCVGECGQSLMLSAAERSRMDSFCCENKFIMYTMHDIGNKSSLQMLECVEVLANVHLSVCVGLAYRQTVRTCIQRTN
jgi:hypothetical protein